MFDIPTAENLVEMALRERQTTADIGGTLGTREVGDWIKDHIHG